MEEMNNTIRAAINLYRRGLSQESAAAHAGIQAECLRYWLKKLYPDEIRECHYTAVKFEDLPEPKASAKNIYDATYENYSETGIRRPSLAQLMGGR